MSELDEDAALLPTYSHEQRLEDESFDELRPILRALFIARDQRSRDFGVDLTLELLLGDRASNYTTMIQVKARSGLSRNDDGSLSLRLESQNVEYLLNAAGSTVVLYDADRKGFYWASVLDEVFALEAKGVNYRTQTKVTIRFVQQLNAGTVARLHADLLDELRAARRLRVQIAALGPNDLVHVDTTGRGATTSDVEKEFFTLGWSLAARGGVEEVARMFGLLNPSTQQGARARLLMAHAHASNGQAVAAWSHANEARRGANSLSADDRDILELIDIGVDHALGRAETADLVSRERVVRDRSKPALRIQLDVSALRHEITLSGDPEKFGDFATTATRLVASTSAAVGPLHPATLAARVLESEVSGNALAYRYARLLMTCRYGDTGLGLQMRNGRPVTESVRQMNDELAAWLRANVEAQNAASEWPLLALELEKSELLIYVVLLRYTRLMGISDGTDTAIDLDVVPGSDALARARDLRERASRLRVDDVEMRARILLLELLDLGDRGEPERAEAESLVEFCKACGYKQIEDEARLHLEGRSGFREARREMTAARDRATRKELVSTPPEERARMADGMRALLNLPLSRLPNIVDGVDCMVEVEELHAIWCQHLDVQEHLGHTQGGATLYARRPLRRCVCEPRTLISMFPIRDWRALIRDFRRAYCEGCPVRAPL